MTKSPWTSLRAVRSQLDDVPTLAEAFRWDDAKHRGTWFKLDVAQQRALLHHPTVTSDRYVPRLSDRLAAAAHYLVTATKRRPEDALTIYDLLVDLPEAVQTDCWKNALWSVMPENTGLPFDEARARHYLERALPHAASQQGLWWHVACVQRLLGDDDACIDALEKARDQGDDLVGPRDESMFLDLWGNERFAAVFADVGPPIVRELDKVVDPLMVRRVDLNDLRRVPEALRTMVNLEEIELSGEFPALPEWLSELPRLRKLAFWTWKLKTFPDAILCMPSLEEVVTYCDLPKGYEAKALNDLLKSFRKHDVPAEVRPIHLGLVLGRRPNGHTDAQLVEALGSSATRVARAAHEELGRRWSQRSLRLSDGGELVVLGRLAGDRTVLGERLERVGVARKRKAGPKTLAVVIGPKHGGKALPHLDGDVPLVLEAHLHAALDAVDQRHLDGADDDTAAQLGELLRSTDEANVGVAMAMIQRGGLPSGLLEELLLVAQNSDLPRKLRTQAKTQFERHAAPDTVKLVQTTLKRTSLYASGETKLASRLKSLDRSELSGAKLARIMLGQGRRGLKYLLKVHKKGPEVVKLLEQLRRGDTLDLSGRELPSVPADLARLENLRVLRFAGNRLRKVGPGLLGLTDLEVLDLSENSLDHVPVAIADLAHLRVLDLSTNYLPGFPDELAALPALVDLTVDRRAYTGSPAWSTLSDGLGKLTQLERLAIGGHSLQTVPECLQALTHLKELAIGFGSWPVLPLWLAELPSLTSLDARYLRVEDEAQTEATFQALVDKGVHVQR